MLVIALLWMLSSSAAVSDMEFEYFNFVTSTIGIKGGKCTGNIIAIDNKVFDLRLTRMDNVKHAFVTDRLIRDCDIYNWDICPHDSFFCQSRKLKTSNLEKLMEE